MKLVDLPAAKALQKLGYDGEYAKMYNTSGELIDIDLLSAPYCIPVPRLDDVAYWLRDRHKISIEPMYSSVLHGWDFAAYDMDYNGVDQLCEVYGDDYEDTLETTVTKAIEIIKNRQQ